jgi:hypothetical protein
MRCPPARAVWSTGGADAATRARGARRALFERTRDRRSIYALHDVWHAALCHRALPAVFPVTLAARPWVDWTLIDLAKRHLELVDVDPHEFPYMAAPAGH